MKRFTAASLAAATALTLVAMPAQAETKDNKKTSADSDIYVAGYVMRGVVKEGLNPGTGLTPAMKSILKDYKEGDDISAVESSLRNDAANGYKVGTTFDILLGTGISAVLLALIGGGAWAAQQGLIPGVAL